MRVSPRFMSIVKHETSRGQSETDTLADAKAMYAAASAHADVKTRLGPKYLGEMKSEIDELESLSAGKRRSNTKSSPTARACSICPATSST